ncbi:SDR family oxidoreductase [Streptosporangium sp. 'caverna']|uniref:SDR family oxidoreductase n=1 Tax=Streptosporangium sp. 'caverna' TaxID=2202249 RepID=UPI000D7E2110|nr:SDR family oxidoreductase [Streptosporangium sp. 'caverna']AWS47334.1 short-chain dehydrogenase [Streptosporangium sp. 'caverna']
MKIENSVAVVTGGNRGLGRHFVTQLIERGAKVYAAARNPEAVDVPGAIPLQLDITKPESVAKAAQTATDVTLLINNAGISTHSPLIDGDFDQIRLEMETHYFGSLGVTRAFAPVIESNGGGAILNVLSILSWVHPPDYGAYSAAKAAEWAMTDAVRQQLAPRGIHVSSLHVGYMDTDMASYVDPENKVDPVMVVSTALEGIASDTAEIIADERSRIAKRNLAAPLTVSA